MVIKHDNGKSPGFPADIPMFFLPIYSGFPVAIITGVLIGRDRLKGRPSAMSAVYRSSKTRFHKSSFKALFTQSRFSPQNYFDIL